MRLAIIMLLCGCAAAQTTINGSRTITGAWDAGGASWTIPARKGTGEPAGMCSTGEIYFRTDAAAAQNLYLCHAGAWVMLNGSSGSAALVSTAGTGHWWPFGTPASSSAIGAAAASRVYYQEFVIPAKLAISKIAFRVQTAGASAATAIAFGLYGSNCSRIAQGVKSSGLNVANYYSVDLGGSQTLDPGVYFLAWSTEDTTLQLGGAAAATVVASLLAADGSQQRMFYGSNAATGTGATFSLPASCGTRTSGGVMYPHTALLP